MNLGIEKIYLILVCGMLMAFGGCHPTPGPDKAFSGAVLGAGWGAGAGAVVGNQIGHTGPGAAIGAGFGAVSGLLTGAGLDIAEGNQLESQRALDSLRIQVASNRRQLAYLQNQLDERERKLKGMVSGDFQIFFDPGRASLRTGSSEKLQRLAEWIKLNPYVGMIEVHGHSDDNGKLGLNQKLSQARARTVANFLIAQGISADMLSLIAHGSVSPIATNETPEGRQLNRRVEVVIVH